MNIKRVLSQNPTLNLHTQFDRRAAASSIGVVPEASGEGKVDFEKLRPALDDEIAANLALQCEA